MKMQIITVPDWEEYNDEAENLKQHLGADDVLIMVRRGNNTWARTARQVDLRWLERCSLYATNFFESQKEKYETISQEL